MSKHVEKLCAFACVHVCVSYQRHHIESRDKFGWEEGHMSVTEQETGSRSQRRSDCLWVSPDITGWKHSNNVLEQCQLLLCSFLCPLFFFIFNIHLFDFFALCFLFLCFFSLSFHLFNFFFPFFSSFLILPLSASTSLVTSDYGLQS